MTRPRRAQRSVTHPILAAIIAVTWIVAGLCLGVALGLAGDRWLW